MTRTEVYLFLAFILGLAAAVVDSAMWNSHGIVVVLSSTAVILALIGCLIGFTRYINSI